MIKVDLIRNLVYLFKYKDLKKRAIFIILLLFIFRITANIPLPGVDLERVKNLIQANQFLGLLNIFIGNTLSNFSIALLGLGPYITAVIIMQLLTLVYPKLKEMYYEEGEAGRAKFNQYARIITIPLTLIQSFGFLKFLEAQNIIIFNSYFDIIRDVIIITAGTIFLMWLGELITEQKLANGISLLIFSGIVSRTPQVLQQVIINFSLDKLNNYIILILVSLFIITSIVYINEAERRIPLNFSKRVRGTKLYGGVSTYLPIKINQAGVIPIIFAISILLFPQTLFQFLAATGITFFTNLAQDINNFFQNQFIFSLLYFILVFAFTYFYTSITFEPNELALNFQRSGAFIPGIRPGKETSDFFKNIVNKINFFGGIFLGLIAILPYITQSLTNLSFVGLGGTSILILVSVAIETIKKIESEVGNRQYSV
ncbi:MAG: protein translocase subunit SecY [Candidatus Parcubacteria bacterium]|nr:MAG: protein translocase subunit SecY [Candidatus Parcubacteria bacterium]